MRADDQGQVALVSGFSNILSGFVQNKILKKPHSHSVQDVFPTCAHFQTKAGSATRLQQCKLWPKF